MELGGKLKGVIKLNHLSVTDTRKLIMIIRGNFFVTFSPVIKVNSGSPFQKYFLPSGYGPVAEVQYYSGAAGPEGYWQ